MNLQNILTMPLGIDAGPGRNLKGVLMAANENRFEASHLSEPLTAYVRGLPESDVGAILELAAPRNPAPRRFEYRAFGEDEALLVETDDIRAIGAAFQKVQIGQSTVNAKTHNKGLCITLDKDELVDGDEEAVVAMLIARLQRNDLSRVITLLDSLDTNVAKTWSTGTTTPPDSDIAAQITVGGDALGVDPNIVLFGGGAWNKRMAYYEASTGNTGAATYTPEQVAQKLMVDRVVVCKERQRSVKGGSKSAILGDYVYIYQSGQPTRFDPGHVKRFVTPAAGGGDFAVYREEHAKTIDVSVDHYSVIASAMTTGVRRITAS